MFLQILVSILFFTEVSGLYFTSVYKNETDGQIYLDVKGIANSTFEEQHELLKLINAILIQQPGGPKIIIEGDYLPTMIKMINSKNTTIQFDTLLILFNIANISAEYAEAIFDENAIPALLEITTADSSDEITTIFSLEILKIIIKHDFFSMTENMKSTIAAQINKLIHSDKASSTHTLNNAIGIMTMLWQCVNSPLPLNDINVFVIPALEKCLGQHSAAPETITVCIASLGLLTLSDQQQQQLYFDDEIIKELFQLVNHKNETIQKTSIIVLGNIFAAEKDIQRIEALFDHTIFETFSKIFKNGNSENVKVVASFIRKLFVSTKIFIEPFIKSTAFSALMELAAAENGNAAQSDDAHLILLTVISYGDFRHILLLDQMNIITKMCHIFFTSSIYDQNLLKMSLLTFTAILQKSEDYKCVILEKLVKCGAMEIIDHLEKTHDVDEIRAISKIITSSNRLQKLEGTCSKQF